MHTLSPRETRQQVHESGVCTWWQLTQLLRAQGPDTFAFLDSVSTQHLDAVELGTARFALFLTNKARIIAPTLAYRVDDECVLLELDPALVDELVPHLKRYRLRARCALEVVDLGMVSVVGPRSEEYTGDGWFRSPAFGAPARTFVGTRAEAAALVNDGLPAAGIHHADPEALDALRIERGVAGLGDMLVGSMPAEVGAVEPAVSLTKGCYLGQEPVARLHYRGKPNRTLRTVVLSHELPADYGADSDHSGEDYLSIVRRHDGRAVGRLTSWARNADDELVGLAVLRREVDEGEQLLLAGADVNVTPREPARLAADAT